ncbi:MAG: hypothetical protein K6G07_02425 [Lachnospiraceae bacterium]|nr:hypothetical protein [Lachnospiraceae bacterium]
MDSLGNLNQTEEKKEERQFYNINTVEEKANVPQDVALGNVQQEQQAININAVENVQQEQQAININEVQQKEVKKELVVAPLETEKVRIEELNARRMTRPVRGFKDMTNMELRLFNAKRGEKKDGKEMKKIKELHTSILGYENVAVTQENEKKITDMLVKMSELCKVCDAYVANHNPWTDVGKERMKLVKELRIKTNLQRDAFMDVSKTLKGWYKEFSVSDVFVAMQKGISLAEKKMTKEGTAGTMKEYDDVLSGLKTHVQKEVMASHVKTYAEEATDRAINVRNNLSFDIKKKTSYKESVALAEFCTEGDKQYSEWMKTYTNAGDAKMEEKRKQHVAEIGKMQADIDVLKQKYKDEESRLYYEFLEKKKPFDEEKTALNQKKWKNPDKKHTPEDLARIQELEKQISALENERKKAEKDNQDKINAEIAKVTEVRKEFLRQRKEDAKPKRKEILDKISKQIMEVDYASLNLSTDEHIAKNASYLEELEKKIGAFGSLLSENPDFMKELPPEEGLKLRGQISALHAIVSYYRIRKQIMMEPAYARITGDISLEDAPADTFEIHHLKKLLRTSYYLGKNMRVASGVSPVSLKAPEVRRKEELKLDATKEADFAKSVYAVAYKEALEKKDAKAAQEAYLEYLKVMEDKSNAIDLFVGHCEQEGLFVPTDVFDGFEMKAPTEYNKSGLAGCIPHKREIIFENLAPNTNVIDGIRKNEKDLKAEVAAPIFNNPMDPLLAKMEVSDNLHRMVHHYQLGLHHKKTDAEIIDIVTGLFRNKSKVMDKNDPELLAYLEDEYKESVLKQFLLQYGLTQRVANALGDKPFYMHQVDMALQMTDERTALLAATSLCTNYTQKKNIPLIKEFYKKYNADGRYLFDVDEMADISDQYGGTFSFQLDKLSYIGVPLYGNLGENDNATIEGSYIDLVNRSELDEDKQDEYDEIKNTMKELTGDDKFYTTALNEVKEYCKNHPNDAFAKKIDFEKIPSRVDLLAVHSMIRPEKYGAKVLNTEWNQENQKKGRSDFNARQADIMFQALERNKKVPWRPKVTEKDLAAYEKSLKDRKFFKYQEGDDPYDLKHQYRQEGALDIPNFT